MCLTLLFSFTTASNTKFLLNRFISIWNMVRWARSDHEKKIPKIIDHTVLNSIYDSRLLAILVFRVKLPINFEFSIKNALTLLKHYAYGVYVGYILHEILGMRKQSEQWVPYLLTLETTSQQCWALFKSNPKKFLRPFVTVDKTWSHWYTPETKQESKQWTSK